MGRVWYKSKNSLIWWKDTPDIVGLFIFSFDKKTEFIVNEINICIFN